MFSWRVYSPRVTLFEQLPRRSVRPVDDGPFAALARARRRRRWWTVTAVGGAVLLLVAGVVVGTGADRVVIDQVAAWTGPKTLPADISTVADRAFLSEGGRALLTEVGAREAHGDDLSDACGGADSVADHVIDGCFTPKGIFVFVPTDARVADAAVTTLAHELLHAAFVRLGRGEVWRVRDLLHEAIERVASDDPVRQQIDWSVGDHEELRDTELFAYLGSQVRPDGGFAPELEEVYARYFTDRAALVEVQHRVTAEVQQLIVDYEGAVDELTRTTTDAANAHALLENDRQTYELNRQSYQGDADRYNAMDPVERGRFRVEWSSSDGSAYSGTWSEVRAARLGDLDKRHADLEARALAVEAADAAAVARPAEIEAQFADVLTVTQALDPTASGS